MLSRVTDWMSSPATLKKSTVVGPLVRAQICLLQSTAQRLLPAVRPLLRASNFPGVIRMGVTVPSRLAMRLFSSKKARSEIVVNVWVNATSVPALTISLFVSQLQANFWPDGETASRLILHVVSTELKLVTSSQSCTTMVVPATGVTRSPVKAILLQAGHVASKVMVLNLAFQTGMGVSELASKKSVRFDQSLNADTTNCQTTWVDSIFFSLAVKAFSLVKIGWERALMFLTSILQLLLSLIPLMMISLGLDDFFKERQLDLKEIGKVDFFQSLSVIEQTYIAGVSLLSTIILGWPPVVGWKMASQKPEHQLSVLQKYPKEVMGGALRSQQVDHPLYQMCRLPVLVSRTDAG